MFDNESTKAEREKKWKYSVIVYMKWYNIYLKVECYRS